MAEKDVVLDCTGGPSLCGKKLEKQRIITRNKILMNYTKTPNKTSPLPRLDLLSLLPCWLLALAALTKEVQHFAEEVPELSVEDSVDDGVQSTVDVAQPRDNAGDFSGDVAGCTYGSCDVDHKEGRPAEEENTYERERAELVNAPCTSGNLGRR